MERAPLKYMKFNVLNVIDNPEWRGELLIQQAELAGRS